MLSEKGFDLWADGYDKTVALSEEENSYPFAGYKAVLGEIYAAIRQKGGSRLLDIGFGTGVLAKRLYDDGFSACGIDFSGKMIAIAKEKMPDAKLYHHDFSNGLPLELADSVFDHITCTYAIHHLDDRQKTVLIKELLAHLAPDGQLFIGDVAFETEEELITCKNACGEEWDDDEIYPVAEILRKDFPALRFQKISFCAGILTFTKDQKGTAL